MSWIAVAVGGGALIAGTGAALGASNSPGSPGQRGLSGELGAIGGQYPNMLNTFQGGMGSFNNSSLGGINTLNRGTFDSNKWFTDHPGMLEDFNSQQAAGELKGWTPEMFAKEFMGGWQNLDLNEYNKYLTGGLPEINQNLNTQTRTNNLQDVMNLGGQYTQLMRDANKPYYSQLDKFTQSANQPVAPSGSQVAARNQAAGGFGTFNPSGLMANTSFNSQTINPTSVTAPNSMLNVSAPHGSPLLSQMNQQAMAQGPSGLQQQQNALASDLLSQGGNLSASDLRNVQQSSRGAFGARGLDATNASIVDEAMQTDQARRQRMVQNLGIAQGVQNQGMAELGQQQQFGLGVSNQNFGYGQLGLQAQQANQGAFQNLNSLNLQGQLANQGANLSAQQANQGANLQAQGLGLQAQQANQSFGLGSFNANLNSQQMQQQALQQAAMLEEQQRQSQMQTQLAALNGQRQGFLDPFSAIMGAGDPNIYNSLLNQNNANMGIQSNLFNGLMGYGQDLNNTNYNANAASKIAQYNGQQAMYGGMVNLGGSMMSGGMAACWVAREVYGEENPRWLQFREFLFTKAPAWFRDVYLEHGETFAAWLKKNPALKPELRDWMDEQIATLSPS